MSEWKEYKIKNITSRITSGGTPKSSEASYYDGTIPWLNTKEINFNRITKTERYITEEGLNNSSAKWIPKGSVIIAMYGATAAKVAYSLIDLTTNQACCNLIIDEDKANSQFVYYYIQSSYEELLNLACGAAQQNLSVGVIGDFPIYLPPLDEQKRIASILSSLDDKIDLLNRENATLEAMAETLFRQWFIEEAKEDWEDVPLGDVIKTTSGGTPSRKHTEYYNNGTINWVKSKELQGTFISSTEELITENAISNSSAKMLPMKSVLIAMYGATVGEYGILSKPMTCNQAVCALIPNDNYPYTYLFVWAALMKEDFINLASGAAQQNISQDLIKQQMVSSDINLIKLYDEQVRAYFEKMECNQKQIILLSKQRDILLPKLMSDSTII
jgi:type I restriction enzyme S subunit